ncbi:hypothetical protein [Phytomonospora endophytica]|uniref:Uncharacterized protein n=1 Tax=Phytomonospora endophytica TaxID=714109 RepID=A0A841FJN0_9ACTN|nr:hypothetical protein [Phytomonospora endophytica]MBB6035153.1 hypothetical protein [Phytomonospora endophytica]GIG64098.1 hypothetical protein Pen01_03930 [Phytomonospora endophytica]
MPASFAQRPVWSRRRKVALVVLAAITVFVCAGVGVSRLTEGPGPEPGVSVSPSAS